MEQKNNWAPRIGFSWDVNGDSTFKVFGNVGRYHLALPNNVSVRGSNPSLRSAQYFTYTGIAADGTPTPLLPDEIETTPTAFAEVAGRRLPVGWHLAIPGHGLAVDTSALNAQSWMDTTYAYWEGPIRVSGSHAGSGYMELTGY